MLSTHFTTIIRSRGTHRLIDTWSLYNNALASVKYWMIMTKLYWKFEIIRISVGQHKTEIMATATCISVEYQCLD